MVIIARMARFKHLPHPRILERAHRGPARIADEHVGLNGRVAAVLTRYVGSMWSVYLTLAVTLGWMALATWGPLRPLDPFPFPFMLFLGNVVQLLLTFVILVGQQVLGRAADRRAMQTYEDAEAIFQEVLQLHDHLEEQDRMLSRGFSLLESDPHPWIEERQVEKPVAVRHQMVTANQRIAVWITERVGSMWAFYLAAAFQFAWIGMAQSGLFRFDPYPFPFLLFLSSLTQLILMFVIMVGQDVLGRAGDRRSEQTYLDAEAILHECHRLQRRLTAQDHVIEKLCAYIQRHAPEEHPIWVELRRPRSGPAMSG
jgi:uncharacterized membrane protein